MGAYGNKTSPLPLPFPPAAPGAGLALAIACVCRREDGVDASGFGYVGPVHYHQLCMVCSETRRRFFVSVYCDFEIRTEDLVYRQERN